MVRRAWARAAASPVSRSFRSSESILARSEEHTSELQSQSNLVCRLLLEKKKVELTLHREGRRPKSNGAVILMKNMIVPGRRSAPLGFDPSALVLGRSEPGVVTPVF